jgi:hypothetical protein
MGSPRAIVLEHPAREVPGILGALINTLHKKRAEGAEQGALRVQPGVAGHDAQRRIEHCLIFRIMLAADPPVNAECFIKIISVPDSLVIHYPFLPPDGSA